VEQDGIAQTELPGFFCGAKTKQRCAARHEAEEDKLTRRIACKREWGQLKRVVGIG
jgi:hypothetical protein